MDSAQALELQCVLHVSGETDSDTVVPFSESTWKTAGNVAQARRKYQKRSKYLEICESINFKAEPQPSYGFHSGCYSKFTAYKNEEKSCSKDEVIETRSTVSKQSVGVASTSGVLEKKCIFCKSPGRVHFPSGFENLSTCETLQAQESIKRAARQQRDQNFLREFENMDFIAKEVKYHTTCKKRYVSKGSKIQEKESSETYARKWEPAFLRLISYIDSEIFENGMSEKLAKLVDVNDKYIQFLKEEGFEKPTSSPYHLLTKIKDHYGSKLQIHQESKKQGTYISIAKNAINNEIKNVALFLREKILQLRENKLPSPVTVNLL